MTLIENKGLHISRSEVSVKEIIGARVLNVKGRGYYNCTYGCDNDPGINIVEHQWHNSDSLRSRGMVNCN
jgi:hypothetical protein